MTPETTEHDLQYCRCVQVTNGHETRTMVVYHTDARGFMLHDATDIFFDSLQPLADESDSSIMDAIRDNGFEIVSVAP